MLAVNLSRSGRLARPQYVLCSVFWCAGGTASVCVCLSVEPRGSLQVTDTHTQTDSDMISLLASTFFSLLFWLTVKLDEQPL